MVTSKMVRGLLDESLLQRFCSKEEHQQVLQWLTRGRLERPHGFESRVEHAQRLSELGNAWYRCKNLRRALHCALGALHALDWSPAEQLNFSEEEQACIAKVLVPVFSNLAMLFLRRGDFVNSEKASVLSLRCAQELPNELCINLHTQFLFAEAERNRTLAENLTGTYSDWADNKKEFCKRRRHGEEVRRSCNASAFGALAAEASLKDEEVVHAIKDDPPAAEEAHKDESNAVLAWLVGRWLVRTTLTYMSAQASVERSLDTVRRTNVMVCLGTVVLLGPILGMCMYCSATKIGD